MVLGYIVGLLIGAIGTTVIGLLMYWTNYMLLTNKYYNTKSDETIKELAMNFLIAEIIILFIIGMVWYNLTQCSYGYNNWYNLTTGMLHTLCLG